MVTRREFGVAILTAPLAGAVAAAAQARASVPRFASRFAGVRIGAQTYCYRSLRDTTQPWSAQRVDQLMDAVTTAMARNRIDLAEFWLALAYLELGRHDDAMVAALASRDEIANAPTWIVGYAHARSGRYADALEVKRAIEAQARTMYVPASDLAFLAIGLGQEDEALEWLDRGFEERSHWMELLAVHPLLDPIRDQPRFAELLRRMKLPPDAWRRP